MLLVTGPTGSGKTTTLYAAITEINTGQDKIVTIEDPVEYQLPGVLQIPVNEKKGLTFASGLRSILRHDPDKIMVGEIRDPETAKIAVQSALTGHLVFTTVHANNVFDVIGRFMHMDIDLYGFVSALNAIVAQRLVRLVCTHCAEPDSPSAELLQESGIADPQGYKFVQGKGCGECRGAGYRGRSAIAELLILNDEMRELIVVARAGAPSQGGGGAQRHALPARRRARRRAPRRHHATGDQPCHFRGVSDARCGSRPTGWKPLNVKNGPATSPWCCPTTSRATPSCSRRTARRRRKSWPSPASSSPRSMASAPGAGRCACRAPAPARASRARSTRALLERLKACFPKGGKARLVSVQPALMAAYNGARDRIPREGAWLLLVEAGRACLARLAAHGWASVHHVAEGEWER